MMHGQRNIKLNIYCSHPFVLLTPWCVVYTLQGAYIHADRHLTETHLNGFFSLEIKTIQCLFHSVGDNSEEGGKKFVKEEKQEPIAPFFRLYFPSVVK